MTCGSVFSGYDYLVVRWHNLNERRGGLTMSQGMLGNLSLSDTQGPRKDIEDKLAGPKGTMWLRRLKRFLRGENPFGVPKTFEVTTNGRSGDQHITDLEVQGDRVDDYAQELLRGKEFVATDGKTYKLAIIMGDEFEDDKRTNENIRVEAAKRGYLDPSVELAPYVREMFSDEDLEQMGLWALIVMHQPVSVSCGFLSLLGLRRCVGGRWLNTFDGRPDGGWSRGRGFLFLVPASN